MRRIRAASFSLTLVLLLISGSAFGAGPHVIEAGQEALLQSMLAPAEGLPGGFAFKTASIERDHVLARYAGPAGEAVVRLDHPQSGAAARLRTPVFSLSGSAPAPLLEAIAASVKKRGGTWRWRERSTEPAVSAAGGEQRIIDLLDKEIESGEGALASRVEEIFHLKAGLPQDRDSRWVDVEVGRLYSRAGREDEARAAFSAVLEGLEEEPGASLNAAATRARALVGLGKIGAAMTAVDEAWPPAERGAEACGFSKVGADLLKTSQVAAGLELCARIAKAAPDCERVYLVLRHHLLDAGPEAEEVLDILKQGASYLPDSRGITKLMSISTTEPEFVEAGEGGGLPLQLIVVTAGALLLGAFVLVRRRRRAPAADGVHPRTGNDA